MNIENFFYRGRNGRLQMTAEAFRLFSDERTSTVPKSGEALDQRVTKQLVLNRQGLLTGLAISIQGTLLCTPIAGQSSGTITGGTWRGFPNPMPYSILKRVELQSATGVNLIDASGFGLHCLGRLGYGRDMSVSTSSVSRFADEQAYLGGRFSTSSYGFQSGYGGGAIATGSFTAGAPLGISTNMQLYIPVAMNPELDFGMISLQQNTTDYILKLTTGDVTGGLLATGGSNDVFNGLTGTNMQWTWNATAGVDMITRTPIFEYQAQALLSKHLGILIDEPVYMDDLLQWAHSARSTFINGMVNGRNRLPVASTDLIMAIFAITSNGGVPLTRADIQNPSLSHSGSQVVRQESYATQGLRNFWFSGNELPNGVMSWPLARGKALQGHPDLDDALNNQTVTNVEVQYDIPSSTVITAATGNAPTGVDLFVQSLVNANQVVEA